MHVSQLPPLVRRDSFQMELQNFDRFIYLINVTIGTPPQELQLHLDTGSSDTWVPHRLSNGCEGNDCKYGVYEQSLSSTYKEMFAGINFNTQYEDGAGITGIFFSDTLDMGHHRITNMIMALATNMTSTEETPPVEGGIMGIGYMTGEARASETANGTYPNVPTELRRQGHISRVAYSLWLNDDDSSSGNILFGGVDTAKYHGDLVAVPIVPSKPSGIYDSFIVAFSGMSITDECGKKEYSRENLALPIALDSGTSITYLPDDLAIDILQGVGASLKENEWVVPCALGSKGASINFSFGGAGGPTIPVLLEDLCLPTIGHSGERYDIKLDNGEQACRFGILPMNDTSIDRVAGIFGDTFLRSVYAVYDLDQNVIALAKTNFNATDSNISEITDSSIPGVTATAKTIDVVATLPTVTNEFVPASPTFEFAKAAAKQKSAAAPAVGQLSPRLSFQVVMSGFAVVVTGMLGGSLMVLW
ncbi:aspartic peptidase domain-containing protein [Phyllosticta citricarpa]